MTIVLWVAGGLIVILLVVGVVISMRSQSDFVEDRIEKYLDDGVSAEFGESSYEDDEPKTSALTEWVNNLVTGSNFGDKIAGKLARADLKFKPGEYVAVMVISSIAVGVGGFFIGGGTEAIPASYAFIGFGAVFGWFIPGMYVKQQQKARLKKFGDLLPDMLTLMVNGLRAGFSTMQALEAVSKELPPPINTEFRRVVQEMQLGIPMERSLDNLLRRIPSEDLDLAITAINVQREVGGNLAEILDTISHTIRERIRIKGEIVALTAQVQFSGTFISLLPILLSLVLWVVNRDYMMQFFLEPKICGLGMLGCSLIMIIVGYVTMQKIADIEI